MADVRRLVELSMVPELAKEVASQIGSGGAVASVNGDTGAVVLEGAAVANCTVAADGTSAGTQLNALLASLRAAGLIAT